jgi:O-acetyl-ADP-ribose deacetylase (regulator of RNase III)
MRIRVEEGDIAAAEADAIVCLCNTRLEPVSDPAAALVERAGTEVRDECESIGALPLGDAVVTGPGALACTHLIHAAIETVEEGTSEESLRAAVRSILERARERGLLSLAMPAPGSGIALQRCAEIMFEEARAHGEAGTSLGEVRFVLCGEPRYRIFEQVGDADRIRASLARLAR